MCLCIDKNKTNKAKKNKTGKVVRWKVVERTYNDMYSPCRFYYKYKPGWNISNRIYKTLELNGICNKGIHVFTSRNAAREFSCFEYGYRIVKVICYNKDLIAVGKFNDEVYMKVFFPKDEYDDAIKRESVERKRNANT